MTDRDRDRYHYQISTIVVLWTTVMGTGTRTETVIGGIIVIDPETESHVMVTDSLLPLLLCRSELSLPMRP